MGKVGSQSVKFSLEQKNYNLKYSRHFYTNKEIDNFKLSWI